MPAPSVVAFSTWPSSRLVSVTLALPITAPVRILNDSGDGALVCLSEEMWNSQYHREHHQQRD